MHGKKQPLETSRAASQVDYYVTAAGGVDAKSDPCGSATTVAHFPPCHNFKVLADKSYTSGYQCDSSGPLEPNWMLVQSPLLPAGTYAWVAVSAVNTNSQAQTIYASREKCMYLGSPHRLAFPAFLWLLAQGIPFLLNDNHTRFESFLAPFFVSCSIFILCWKVQVLGGEPIC